MIFTGVTIIDDEFVALPSWVVYYPEEPGKFVILLDKADAVKFFLHKRESHPERKTLIAFKEITLGTISKWF